MRDEPGEIIDSPAGLLLHEMLATIEDELRDGSTLNERFDSFKKYFEAIFEIPIEDIDDTEELIQNDTELIDLYFAIRAGIAGSLDIYFGITFEDIYKVTMNDLYNIYQVVYLKFVQFLYMYALGKCIGSKKMLKDALKEAEDINIKENIEVSDTLVGNYIFDEDEFTSENIALALDRSDPGNLAYLYLFGEPIDPRNDVTGPMETVYIDNNAFRLRVKKEYLEASIKYILETIFRKNME
jgi:hypothetical protein